MSDDNDFLLELQDGFLQEASDLLSSLEDSFLKIENNPDDKSELEKIFRIFHNIKGSAAAVGFDALSEFCHAIENLLTLIRKGNIPLNSQNVDVLLKCNDRVVQFVHSLSKDKKAAVEVQDILKLVAEASEGVKAAPSVDPMKLVNSFAENLVLSNLSDLAVLQEIKKQLEALRSGFSLKQNPELFEKISAALHWLTKIIQGGVVDGKTISEHLTPLCAEIQKVFLSQPGPALTAKPSIAELDTKLLQDFLSDASDQLESADQNLLILEKNHQDKEAINALFRAFHTMKSACGIMGLAEVETIAHEVETLLDAIRDGSMEANEAVVSLCLEASSFIRNVTQNIKNTGGLINVVDPTLLPPLHEKLKNEAYRRTPTPLGASKTEDRKTESTIPAAEATATASAEVAGIREAIKVDADRLDRLIDTIGELVIAETMVTQSPELKQFNSGTAVFNHLSHLNKITRRLQEIGMSLRMVPVRPTFKKMTRIVRDISKKLNKEINFEISGEETELDKTIVDKIGDPLVHMVRNAVDHGIENNVNDRLQAGKTAAGNVCLRAFHKGGSIWIEVADDGRGLNAEMLVKKAIEKKVIKEGTVLTDREAFNLIFEPGFSTAEKVTDVSGRGVGMDVVRRNIEELRGQVDIRSELGKGTVFTIRIPHTLAIIEGMVIVVGKEHYVIPTHSIIRSVKPQKKEIHTISGGKGELYSLQGELLPLFRLGEFYQVPHAEKSLEHSLILIVEEDEKKIGLMIDRILRQQQFVIKGMNDYIKDIPGVSGGTIMPDGSVGLILDVGSIIKQIGSA